METTDIIKLAGRHGLQLKGELGSNEMGIDFKVVFALAFDDTKWVLRVPRRDNLAEQIEKEKRILNLAKKHVSVAVPDWQVTSAALVAYPLLEDKPVITFDAETYEVTWNIDQNEPRFDRSLASVLVALHQIPIQEAAVAGLKVLTPEMARQEILERIETVKRELGLGTALEFRWRKWLDNDRLWPDFTTFVHGDLYAGHILATKEGRVSGIIDWSEGQVNDPSIDFAGHISAFGEERVKGLISEYQQLGGRVWNKMFEQTVERHAAAPLNYGLFAVISKNDTHIKAAKAQLGLE